MHRAPPPSRDAKRWLRVPPARRSPRRPLVQTPERPPVGERIFHASRTHRCQKKWWQRCGCGVKAMESTITESGFYFSFKMGPCVQYDYAMGGLPLPVRIPTIDHGARRQQYHPIPVHAACVRRAPDARRRPTEPDWIRAYRRGRATRERSSTSARRWIRGARRPEMRGVRRKTIQMKQTMPSDR